MPGARVGGLAQLRLADEGLRCRIRQAGAAGDRVRRLGVEVVVREMRRIHPRVRDQLALQSVEHDQVRLAIEDRQQLILAIAHRDLLGLGARPARQVGQRPRGEVLQAGVALVEAPPHAPGQRLHLVGGDLVPPRPGQRALAHAADRHQREQARAVQPRWTAARPSQSGGSTLSRRPTSGRLPSSEYQWATHGSGGGGISAT